MGFLEKITNKRKIEIPPEFRRVRTDDDLCPEQSDLIYGIANFIDVHKLSFGITSFTVTPVRATKRLLQLVKRFGNDNLEMNRQPVQLTKQRRKMVVTYKLLIYFQNNLYRVEMVVYTDASAKGPVMTSIYDNQLQDICNIIAMEYLKTNYPYIHTLFNRCIEIPALETFKTKLKEVIRYKINETPMYRLQGAMFVHTDTVRIRMSSDVPVGELIGTKQVVMTD